MTQLWYLAYGSNLQSSLLARYLAAPPDSRETRWARLERSLYFAGDSRHWRGPVAFVSLNPTTDSTMYTACLAIRVTPEELQRVFRAENGLDAALGSVCDLLDVGEWVEILMRRPEDSRQGKYNVVLRGPDIAGQPSFTFTTARTLPVGTPSSAYARAIEEGVGSWQGSDAASRYVSRRTQPSTGDNRIHLAARGHSHVWSGEISRGKFSGYPAVRLPRSLSPVEGAQNFLGRIHVDGNDARVWVDFGLADFDDAQVTASVARKLGVDATVKRQGVIRLDDVAEPARLSGRLEDISVSDVIQVADDAETPVPRWALAITPHISAPVRVVSKNHVPKGKVRMAYALRILLSVDRTDAIALQPIRPVTASSRLRRTPRLLAEYILGAPTIALRATEGLVGDDGRMVARVDPTTLDFIGLQAGQEAVLSWADRAVVVRVLLQTPETRETMVAQLAEDTGKQLRDSTSDPMLRLETPEHLRAWVSSSVRHALEIPPDTVVRLRRSIRHTMIRSASASAVPAVGLVIAAAALDLSWWVWLSATVLLLVLVGLPLRLKSR